MHYLHTDRHTHSHTTLFWLLWVLTILPQSAFCIYHSDEQLQAGSPGVHTSHNELRANKPSHALLSIRTKPVPTPAPNHYAHNHLRGKENVGYNCMMSVTGAKGPPSKLKGRKVDSHEAQVTDSPKTQYWVSASSGRGFAGDSTVK